MLRNRIVYFILIALTVLAGLGTRQLPATFPAFIHLYVGDALWALMVFLTFGFLFRTKSSYLVALAALTFSFLIEISQLYHSGWIDALRNYRLGGLILGFGFLWSDLLCYTAGVIFGLACELILLRQRPISSR